MKVSKRKNKNNTTVLMHNKGRVSSSTWFLEKTKIFNIALERITKENREKSPFPKNYIWKKSGTIDEIQ